MVRSSGSVPELLVCLNKLLVKFSSSVLANLVAALAVLLAARRVSVTFARVSSMTLARLFSFLNIFKFLLSLFL